jgi:5-formyltetrahydrofolate cyclo-ligase
VSYHLKNHEPSNHETANHESERVTERKQRARQEARSTRKGISEADRTQMSQTICAHIETFLLSIPSGPAKIVLTYFSAGSEVNLSGLLDAVGPQLGEPRERMMFGAPIVEGEIMRFGCVRRGEDGSPQTIVGPFGLREPDGPPVELAHVGLVLVPLLAFDSQGNRLGSGKGFYDRFLAANPVLKQRAVIMGVAFEAQRVEDLPTEAHDYRLDAVVTEAGVWTRDKS